MFIVIVIIMRHATLHYKLITQPAKAKNRSNAQRVCDGIECTNVGSDICAACEPERTRSGRGRPGARSIPNDSAMVMKAAMLAVTYWQHVSMSAPDLGEHAPGRGRCPAACELLHGVPLWQDGPWECPQLPTA